MRLQPLPENVGTERRVAEVVRQCVPGHRTGDGERPTAERAATMSWYEEMVAAGRSKSLSTGNIRCGVAAVHEVLGSPALETPVNCHSELMEDPLQNIEPVQLGVKQICRSNFPVLLRTRAAAFSKRCSLSVMVLGDPANMVLQLSMRDMTKACTRDFACTLGAN